MDKQLLFILFVLLSFGLIVFVSASLGLMARGASMSFSSIIFNQIALGIGLGLVTMFSVSKINYRIWRKLSFVLFVFATLLTLSVFIPSVGYSSGGATRWISLFGFSFQPAELLKIATVLFTAQYLSLKYRKLHNVKYGLLPIVLMLAIVGGILFLQPDTGTFVIIAAVITMMFFITGARWRDMLIIFLLGVTAVVALSVFKPYVLDRIVSFINPANSKQTGAYQIDQSLIAIGSGGIYGRGLGQSVQKFNYLPEPTTDSIFAVIGEEFGFIGAILIVFLFLWFAQRSFKIAVKAPDRFGALVVFGLSALIVFQAIFNISAMLRLIPLSGLPLPFVSHGGSALVMMLFSVGIILSVSRYVKV